MIVELDLIGIRRLLIHSYPSLELAQTDQFKKLGYREYNTLPSWRWDVAELANKTEEELFMLYTLCRESTKQQ